MEPITETNLEEFIATDKWLDPLSTIRTIKLIAQKTGCTEQQAAWAIMSTKDHSFSAPYPDGNDTTISLKLMEALVNCTRLEPPVGSGVTSRPLASD